MFDWKSCRSCGKVYRLPVSISNMGKDYCSVFECHNYSGRVGKYGTKVTLRKIPKEQYTRRAWIRAISRKNWMPSSYTRVCSDHFVDGVGPDSVNRNKIPTENFCLRNEVIQVNLQDLGLTLASSQEEGIKFTNNYHPGCHSYAQVQLSNFTAELSMVTASTSRNGTTKATQTCQSAVTDVATEVVMPELVIENISHSNDLIMFYTGLPDIRTFHALFESLMEQGADKLSTEAIGEMNTHGLGRKRKLRRIDEFLLVMMRLRLGLLVKDLEYRFKISASTVSKIFNSLILFMTESMRSIVVLPQLNILQMRVPQCFKQFTDTRVVLDCTEIFVQSPSSLENKSLTYSSYSHMIHLKP